MLPGGPLGAGGGGSSMGCAFTRSEPVPDVSLAGYYNGSANGTDVRLVLHEDGNVSVLSVCWVTGGCN